MIEFFKKNFPITCKYFPSILFGTPLLALNYQWLNGKLPDVILTCFPWVGIVLIFLPILLFILELLSKLFPVLKRFVNLVVKSIDVIIDLYTWSLKLLIKRAVISILEEKKNLTNEDFTLKSTSGSDEFWSRNLDFENIEVLKLNIKPSVKSDYWRLGFKFSENNTFSTARYSNTNPLFHLTKDVNDNSLKLDYYNEIDSALAFRSKTIVGDYNHSELFLKIGLIRHKRSINIEICDEKGKPVFNENFPLNYHRFAQLFAWGDGKEYEIKIRNFVEAIN